ncbi:MAG: class 1 isoprenoid biosynthesis enzyme [Deltaproteobacteria bacterium]|nr:class 1 isoprenoid biosynthesis enzyme [Deltaproteobacteria bacterium]
MRRVLPMSLAHNIIEQTETFRVKNAVWELKKELKEALSLYWTSATEILHGSGIKVLDPVPEYFSMKRNFFSSLFLYSYFRAGIPRPKRILYAAINQCLRGMVTGCDNILDDEYKKTLETDLPEQGTRFRSILDIMVSDRVLFSILYRSCQDNLISPDMVLEACSESLRSLAEAGAQEASEEGGAGEMLKPEIVLSSVHHYKTARLFQCPWAVPTIIEKNEAENAPVMKEALYQIGMGCQILDDMVDLSIDLRMNRHNYIASLISYGANPEERDLLKTRQVLEKESDDNPELLMEFPDAMQTAGAKALSYLKNGAGALFDDQHQFMVDVSIAFIAAQIGADIFLLNIKE